MAGDAPVPAAPGTPAGPHGEALFRLAVEASPNAMVMVDHEGRIALVNAQTEKLFGYARDELIGQRIEMLVPQRHREHHPGQRTQYFGAPSTRSMGIGRDLYGLTRDGREIPVEIGLNPLKTEAGTFVLASIIDITERKRIEDAVRRGEARFRLMVSSVKDYAILMLDPQGLVASWNEGAQRLKGYTEQEILGRHFSMFYPGDDVAAGRPDRELARAREQGRLEDEGWRLRKDGSRFWASVIITPMLDESGTLTGYSKVTRDITERKRSEERFRLVVEAAPNAMIMVDADGRITLVNAQTEKLFGYPREELMGQPVEMLVPMGHRGGHPNLRQSYFQKPQTRSMGVGRDLNGLTRDGRQVPIEIGLNPIDTSEGLFVLASIIDITERKRAEERFRLVVEAAPNAMIMVDADGRITLVNAQTEKLFGYPREELIGQAVEMLVPMGNRQGHPDLRKGYFTQPQTRYMGVGRDLYGQTRDGRQVPIEIGLNPINTAEGLFVLASIIDITERKRAEERFRMVVEAAPNAMIMVDASGRVTLVNAQTEKLFGYPREELIGHPVEMLVPQGGRAGHPKLRESYFHMPQTRSMGVGRDLYGLTRDGRQVPIEIGLNPISTAEGLFVLASIIDITERKRGELELRTLNQTLALQIDETSAALSKLQVAQGQLVQAEKLASLGGLVAGIAHEINTPVGIGVTAASHLDNEVRAMDRAVAGGTLTKSQFERFRTSLAQSSDIILMNLRRAAELIQSFKRVAVDQSSDERRRIHLKAYFEEVLVSLRPKMKTTPHRIELDCPEELELDTIPGAWSQVLTNLVVNALSHAFEPGQPGLMRIRVDRFGEMLRVRFDDTGRGIPTENLAKIFDPFFTTRRGQGGTGLGLHIVFNLVHQTLGGSISVESAPGTGTCFTILLPMHRSQGAAA